MRDNQLEQKRNGFWLRLSLPLRLLIGGSAAFFILCLAVLMCVSALFGNPFDRDPFDDLAFNQTIWKEDASCSDGGNRRGRMAEDLLRHNLKAGMAQERVQALLGPPGHLLHKSEAGQWPLRFQPEDSQAELILEYHVGEEFTFGGGVTWVDLFFDRQGRYVRGRISTPPSDWRVILPE